MLLTKSKSTSKSCFSCPNFLGVEEWASRILEEEKVEA